jgi:hypothetical protein
VRRQRRANRERHDPRDGYQALHGASWKNDGERYWCSGPAMHPMISERSRLAKRVLEI